MKRLFLPALCLLVLCGIRAPGYADEPKPLTVAEKSEYRATARHAQVVEFCKELAAESPRVRLGELGTTFEGKKLPLLIIADPPVATAAEAAKSQKPVVFAMGNIHAGEVDGKEALLMLAREIATNPEKGLLKDLIVVIAPIFNADGNDRMSKTNRPGQVGPEEGMGVRANAQGLDLNRDFMKLESPEVRALVKFLDEWKPVMFIDTHTTNGSYHRYLITYDGPRHPATYAPLVDMCREKMFPDLTRRLEERSKYKSAFYADFAKDHTVWQPYPSLPRYSTNYGGLRNLIAILVESYSYAPYRDRILASREFVHSCFDYVAQHKEEIRKLLAQADQETVRAGKAPAPRDEVAIRHRLAPYPNKVTALGYEEETKNGRSVSTGKPKDYEVEYWGKSEPTKKVQRPFAYLFPASFAKAVETLQRHGIKVEVLREDIELDVETTQVAKIDRAKQAFQKHHLEMVDGPARAESRKVPAGTILVRTGQPLGDLAIVLLEPQTEDGLTTWNFFDDLVEGKDHPVLRLMNDVPLTTIAIRPLAEKRVSNRPINFKTAFESRNPPNFFGSPVSGLTWLADGEHFLQVKAGRLYKVHAATGRLKPFHDPDQMAKGLSSLPTIKKATAKSMASRTSFHMNPRRTGTWFEYENDLYYCNFDGTKAARLTKTPGKKELVSFSPDGHFLAYIRDNNLYSVDIATQTERALTSDGNVLVSNGKADWVYFEEVFNRNTNAYWWSPDSSHIVFGRYDDKPVHKFTVIDQIPTRQLVESTPYPKAGDPNPTVKLGIVSVAGGAVNWVDLSAYSETSSLVGRAGWMPDSQKVYFYVQDRAQTWLDFCTAFTRGGKPERLFRETTKAWVDDPGPAVFLKDGSFLLSSKRSGWRHLYHFDKNGKVIGTVTTGSWEVASTPTSFWDEDALHEVDEKAGWIYLSGNKDSAIAGNLYRVRLDGSASERLTALPGDHRVEVGPKGKYFIDTVSTHLVPPQVRLYRTDGTLSRVLDTNPVPALEEYKHSDYELVRIPTPDGFTLEGSLLKPHDFHPKSSYPVWFMTYGGPHAPTVADNWSRSWVFDQVLADMGFIVFHCDPRSASGKSAVSTWTAYRHLGVEELKDIETAIGWLTSHPYVDASRIGMSGHSYGGFMTAFALTHSKLFAAGIAGAPVTDWRNYDSIYTERYMNTPQENPDGYDASSVVKAAKNLHGKLLLLHGLMDDNVHVQNSVQLIQELQRADKDFEVMFYPHSRHGIGGQHYRRLMVEFIQRTLGQPHTNPTR